MKCDCIKDWCECVKAAQKAAKKYNRTKNVNGVLRELTKNKITFANTVTPNVVRIPTNAEAIILSLKSIKEYNPERTMYKFRIEGIGGWHEAEKTKFISRIKQVQS